MHLIAVNAGADVSGAEGVLISLLRHARSRGDRVTLVCPPGALPEQLAGEVEHVALDIHRLGRSRGWRRRWEILRLPLRWGRTGLRLRRISRGADVLLSNSTFALPVLGVAFPGLPGFPRGGRPRISWLVHDTITSRKQRCVVRLGAHALDAAVAVSGVTAASVHPLVATTLVRPNGVVIPETPLGATATDPARPVVGILAVLTSWKGQDVLLAAIAQLPGVHLEIAGTAFPGSEDFERQLRERATAPDLAGRVRFLGQVHRDEVFPRWDLLISASTSPEAGPLGVLEAMAAGVPVIATDHGGAAEYLSGGAGVLVPPGDPTALAEAIRNLLQDGAAARSCRERARARAVAEHDLADTVPRMLAALTDG